MTPARNLENDPTPDRILIDAARHYARRTAGQGVQRITLTLADGSKRKLEVPAAAAAAVDWPPADGWAVRGDRAAHGGAVFKLAGKSLAVFRELVEAGEDGVAAGELKARVWDAHTEDRTVQNAVSKLRQAIREGLGLGEDVDPVESGDERYRLVTL